MLELNLCVYATICRIQGVVMSTVFNGVLPIEVFEDEVGRICVKQRAASGEEQAITLGLEQAEHLANWFIQYAHTATDALMEE